MKTIMTFPKFIPDSKFPGWYCRHSDHNIADSSGLFLSSSNPENQYSEIIGANNWLSPPILVYISVQWQSYMDNVCCNITCEYSRDLSIPGSANNVSHHQQRWMLKGYKSQNIICFNYTSKYRKEELITWIYWLWPFW